MPARIQNRLLIDTLQQHLKGKSKGSVNFTFEDDIIKVQSSNDFILDTYIKGEYSNDFVGKSFSIMVTSAIQLLSTKEGSTEIVLHGEEVVVFEQEGIVIPFSRTFEDRVNIKWDSLESSGKLNSKDFSDISTSFRNLVNTSKTLEVGVPSILITSGKVYCVYSNTIFIGTVPMAFPDIEIPYNTFSNISKSLTGGSINLYNDINKKLLLIQIGTESAATTTYKKPNLELTMSIESKLNELTYVGNISIKIISELELLFKCFPKENVTISIYEDDTVGVIFSVADGKSVKAGVKDLTTKLNINISTTQFDAIYKTFKGFNSIEVYRGRDIICMKSINNKTLILSGMTF